MTTRRLSFAILGAIVLSGHMAAAQVAKPTIVEDRAQVVAIVESIDLKTRTVLLRGPEDRLLTIEAGPEVRNLPQVHVGDRVVVGYYRGVAVRMSQRGAGAVEPGFNTADMRAAPGQKPAIGAADRLLTRVRIVSVDNAAGTVTFTDHDKTTHTVTLRKPEMRAFARRLKRGDEVDVEIVEALAVSVEPAPR